MCSSKPKQAHLEWENIRKSLESVMGGLHVDSSKGSLPSGLRGFFLGKPIFEATAPAEKPAFEKHSRFQHLVNAFANAGSYMAALGKGAQLKTPGFGPERQTQVVYSLQSVLKHTL